MPVWHAGVPACVLANSEKSNVRAPAAASNKKAETLLRVFDKETVRIAAKSGAPH